MTREAEWACPHCGADLSEIVLSEVRGGCGNGGTLYRSCGSCGKPQALSVYVEVAITGRSFADDNPELAVELANSRITLDTATPASRS